MVRKRLRKKREQRKRDRLSRLKEGFWKRLLRASPVLVLTIVLTFILVGRDEFHEFAAYSQDLLMRISAPPTESKVAVVMIADEEYEGEFKKDGSLNPAKLQELISAIAKGRPKLIGVDIDTSDQRYRDFKSAEWWPPVVWARAVYEPVAEKPTPRDVLGGKDPQLNYEPNSGLPLLYDINGVTRLYQRIIETTEGNQSSFPWAVVKRFNPNLGEEYKVTKNRLMIGFAVAQPEELSATQIMTVADEPWWPSNNQIRNKIVLIGVSYLAQDRHETPIGQMHGVNNMATVIQTELNGGGLEQPGEFAFLPLWIFQSVVLVILFQYFPLHKALLKNLAWSFALICGSALIGSLITSLIASHSLRNWSPVYLAYFLPVGILVFVEQLRDLLNDWRKEKLIRVYGDVSPSTRLTDKGGT